LANGPTSLLAKIRHVILNGNFEEAVRGPGNRWKTVRRSSTSTLDEGMLDGAAAMTRFLNYIMTEPEIAKVR
jgi:5-methyltetrahydrofolate--homocysteine methyltransferase